MQTALPCLDGSRSLNRHGTRRTVDGTTVVLSLAHSLQGSQGSAQQGSSGPTKAGTAGFTRAFARCLGPFCFSFHAHILKNSASLVSLLHTGQLTSNEIIQKLQDLQITMRKTDTAACRLPVVWK